MRRLLLLALCCLPFTSQASFSVSPLNQILEPTQQAASYVLTNLASQRAAYSITALARDHDLQGKELLTATKELRVFPATVVLEPGQSKRIKLLYLGSRAPAKELAYRVKFLQTDVDVSAERSGKANMRYEFISALFIAPKNAKPDLQLTAKQGEQLELTVQNKGTAHQLLRDWRLRLTDAKGKEHIYPETLPQINLLADRTVTLNLAPMSALNGPFTADIELR